VSDILVLWNAARQALAEASTVDELKDIRDRAEAIRAYAQQRGEAHPMLCDIAEIKLRAERRLGELLAETVRPGRPAKTSHDERFLPDGVSWMQSHRWQKVAIVPEEAFERYLAEARDDGQDEPTSAGLYRLAQKRLQKPRSVDYPPPEGKYRCIVVDPPWPIQKILRQQRPMQDELDYAVKSLDEIAALSISELAAEDGCHVYLWTTHKFLPVAFEIFKTWGVRYECLLTWVKPTGMTPFSWMYNTEHVLFGRVGHLSLVRLGLKLSFEASVTGHSEKPEIFYERVRQASPVPRLEMFARQPHEGFVAWGNEAQ